MSEPKVSEILESRLRDQAHRLAEQPENITDLDIYNLAAANLIIERQKEREGESKETPL